MTEKNIQMQKKNADGSFDIYYPKTKAANVIAADGSNLESHLAESTTSAHKAINISMQNGTDLETEVTNLKQSVSDGKNSIATAITGMGQSALGSDTFSILTNKINSISNDANALPSYIISGSTAYVGGVKITGTMPNNGNKHVTDSAGRTLSENSLRVKPPSGGYYDSNSIIGTTDNNWIENNIKQGVSIFGKIGTLVEGKKWASGTVYADYYSVLNVTGLTFRPTIFIAVHSTLGHFCIYWLNRISKQGGGSGSTPQNTIPTITDTSISMQSFGSADSLYNWIAIA